MNRGNVLGIFGMSARVNSTRPGTSSQPQAAVSVTNRVSQVITVRRGGHGQRRAGVLAGLGAEPAQELLGVLAVQLGQVGDLRMRPGHPGHQPAQRVAGVTDGLRPVQVRVQVQPQVALDDGPDLRRSPRRGEPVAPRCRRRPGRRGAGRPGRCGTAARARRAAGRSQWRSRPWPDPAAAPAAAGSGVELAQRFEPQPGGERLDRRTQLVEIVDAQRGTTRTPASLAGASGSGGQAAALTSGMSSARRVEITENSASAPNTWKTACRHSSRRPAAPGDSGSGRLGPAAARRFE